MQKYLRVTMPDDSKWDVPVLLIAQHRARQLVKFYLESSFDEAVKFALEDEKEIIDWVANNMSWADVVLQAQIVNEGGKVNYQEGWVNGKKEIIKK